MILAAFTKAQGRNEQTHCCEAQIPRPSLSAGTRSTGKACGGGSMDDGRWSGLARTVRLC